MKFLFKLVYKSKYIMFLSSFVILSEKYLSSIYIPFLIKEIIDKLSFNVRNFSEYFKILLLYFFSEILNLLFQSIDKYIQNRYNYKFYNIYLKNNIFKEKLRNSKKYFDNRDSNVILSNIYRVSSNCESLVLSIFNVIIPNLIVLVLYILFLKRINYVVSLFIFFWAVLHSVTYYIIYIFNKKVNLELYLSYNDIDFCMNNALNNIQSVKSFSGEFYELYKLKKISKRNLIIKTKINNFSIIENIFNNLVDIFFYIILLTFLIIKFMSNKIEIDDIFFIFYTTRNINEYLFSFISSIFKIFDLKDKIKICLDYLNDKDIIEDETKNMVIINNPSINFNNIYFYYNEAKPIFNNFSLYVPAFQKIGIVGFNGSGKTTLINLLLRLYEVNNGEIFIDNYNIKTDISQESLRNNISYISQDSYLMHRSIKDNIIYNAKNISDEKIVDICKKTNCYDFIMNSKNGFNTIVGDKGTKLSGGQKQKILIARAMIKNAPILIIDEGTSSLDIMNEDNIRKNIIDFIANKTVIFITHKMNNLINFDRIIFLEFGKIIKDGNFKDVSKFINKYYNNFYNNS